jgi:predicted secreted protein
VAIAGKGGSIKFDSGSIAEMGNWSLDVGVDEIDTTNFDSNDWKEFMAGLKEWSGSFEGNLVKGHKAALFDKLGTIVPIELKVTAIDGAITFTGQAFLTGLNVEVPVEDKASISADFRGTGALTPTTT